MTDAVNTLTQLSDGRKHIIQITNESDGTGESAVKKIDISALTQKNGYTAEGLDIDRITGQVGGFNYITLYWDATTDDEIAVLAPGNFDYQYFRDFGPLRDPQSSGFTGDIMLTTDGPVNGASYNIVLECTLRYQG